MTTQTSEFKNMIMDSFSALLNRKIDNSSNNQSPFLSLMYICCSKLKQKSRNTLKRLFTNQAFFKVKGEKVPSLDSITIKRRHYQSSLTSTVKRITNLRKKVQYLISSKT